VNDDRLNDMFHSLDSAAPSHDFTKKVVARATAAKRRQRQTRRAATVIALTITLVGGGAVAQYRAHRAEDALRSEHAAIRSELEQLKSLASQATTDSVIYLGSAGQVEYVIDAADLANAAKNVKLENSATEERIY
jgi:hypothetical protein